jgi:hypothetical protein
MQPNALSKSRQQNQRICQVRWKKLKKEGSLASSFIENLDLVRRSGGVLESSMQCHIHMHKKLHRPMYGIGEKWLLHMETDDESNADNAIRCGFQWILWQFRKFHIPKEQKKVNPIKA